ncbi:MAG: DNA-binding response regulator [Gammaproteobacteria bacterium]|nr:MAG: DNA-binding response regulator [Gammaproteobacteria bacterium]
MRLLLVEDDQLLGEGTSAALKHAGYAVDWVKDAETAELALRSEQYDILVLDVMLPGKSGFDLLKGIREKGVDTPTLMLTARDAIDDRVKGLDTGADDYMVKPFDLDELNARIRSLIRRRSGRSNPTITKGNIVMDPASHVVTKDGENVDLSPREFTLLRLLLENQGNVMSRARLEESLYSWHDEVESNAVEVHIHHLRKKLDPKLIRTIRGVGYVVDKE